MPWLSQFLHMKTITVILALFGGVELSLFAEETPGPNTHGLVAHEWGTFTSVQGADGVLLDWRPLETSKLPKFVYNWQNPGLNRRPAGMPGLGKSVLLTLQRMETPVIYFYSDREQSVDVSVRFPQGLITEWYPQVARIGPSSVPVPATASLVDNYAQRAGVTPGFTLVSLFSSAALTNSEARWRHVAILPSTGDKVALGMDNSGSHYFAARETDADCLRVEPLEKTNSQPELEKFLFYRGVGNFATPLHVTIASAGNKTQDEMITLANAGGEHIKHLFVLCVENGKGRYSRLSQLQAGGQWSTQIGSREALVPLEELSRKLGEELAESLCSEGLYHREAVAMVNTWKDSWFSEDGVRVLYVLPRDWTDRTLPLSIRPAPKELVRVMVGRAEVLTPGLEKTLADDVTKAGKNDREAREHLSAELKKLGRFAQPALSLATRGANPAASQAAWVLFEASANPQNAGRQFE
jgi:hypothetical protein